MAETTKVYEVYFSREVTGRSEAKISYQLTWVEAYSDVVRLKEVGWFPDGAWEVTWTRGGDGRLFETDRKAVPLVDHGRQHVPPAEGRIIAHQACVRQRMEMGDTAEQAEAFAMAKIPFWLGRDTPLRGEQQTLPEYDEEII